MGPDATDTTDFEALANPGIRGLRAYDPGLDLVALRRVHPAGGLVELGSNENTYGPSPAAVAAFAASAATLHRYPDPRGGDLKRALAAHHRFAVDGIALGNGSHELLMLLAQVFAGPARPVVASTYGFAVFAIAACAAGAPLRLAPALATDAPMPRGHDLDAIAAVAGDDAALVYLANPNNPTGTWFPTTALGRLLARLPARTLVVVDEAYLEYATHPALVSATTLLDRHPNLVVTRTFSKAYGLAGLRVGYLLGAPGLVSVIERVRESFNVGGPALAACEAALADPAHVAAVRRDNAGERQALGDALLARGLGVSPSQGNFLLVDFGVDAAAIEAGLVARAVVPRPMAGYGLPTCLRLTVGDRDENRRLLQALDVARA